MENYNGGTTNMRVIGKQLQDKIPELALLASANKIILKVNGEIIAKGKILATKITVERYGFGFTRILTLKMRRANIIIHHGAIYIGSKLIYINENDIIEFKVQ